MIDVSEVVNDPDLAQAFTILRNSGSWLNGVWQSGNTTQVQSYGVISPATSRDIKVLPEGDQTGELRVFHGADPIYVTNANDAVDSTGQSSDILIWRGDQFRVLQVKYEQDYGYYRAIATRLPPD